MHSGFITLHRKIVDWEWYSDANVFRVFTHLILTANWVPKYWKGVPVNRGQKVTSIQHIAEETGLTQQRVRTAIKKLKSTGELTTKSTNKYTLVTLTNYDLYQEKKKQVTSKTTGELTNEEQTTNKQLTTTKQYNNITIKTNEERNIPADFKKSAEDILFSIGESDTELKKPPSEKSDDISENKKPKVKKPNAWGIWVDVNREFDRADPFPSGKDTRAAKGILAQIKDPEKYADILRQYLSDEDKFLMQNGYGLSFLTSKINKYLNTCYEPNQVEDPYCLDEEQVAYIVELEERIAKEEAGKAAKEQKSKTKD